VTLKRGCTRPPWDPRFVGMPTARGRTWRCGDRRPSRGPAPIGLARVDRDGPTNEPVKRCHAIGYPWFAETPCPTAVRDTVDAIGVVPVLLSKLAAGLLSVQVSISPRPLPPTRVSLGESEWSGMSGAPADFRVTAGTNWAAERSICGVACATKQSAVLKRVWCTPQPVATRQRARERRC
jgi:hypothetical protein